MDTMIKKVSVVGAGTMGSQIAVHALCFGYQVAIYDLDPGKLKHSFQHVNWGGSSTRTPVVSPEKWKAAAKNLCMSPSLEAALEDADLVVEAGPEKIEIKQEIFRQMARLAPGHTILATTSSAIPVSQLLPGAGSESRCLNLHFYHPTVITNMVDVMGTSHTRPEIMDMACKWVVSLGCVPLKVKKELFGFCFNRIWRAIKKETLYMWANDFVDHREMDRAWMIAFGTPLGPFGLMDAVGLDVVHDIEMMYYQASKKQEDLPPKRLKEKIGKGELGVKAGIGFYTYPDPEYRKPGFCQPENNK